MTVHLHTGTLKTGLWCPSCNLSSGVGLPVYAMCPSGMFFIAQKSWCMDCRNDLEVSP